MTIQKKRLDKANNTTNIPEGLYSKFLVLTVMKNTFFSTVPDTLSFYKCLELFNLMTLRHVSPLIRSVLTSLAKSQISKKA